MLNQYTSLNIKNIRRAIISLFFLCFLFIPLFSFSQGTFNSNAPAGGNWNAAGSWTLIAGADADGIPDANDDATILATHTIDFTATTSCNNLTILGILNMPTGGRTLTVNANLTMDGTGTISGVASATKDIVVSTNFIIAATATAVDIGGFDVRVTGTSTINGSLNWSNSTGTKLLTGDVTISGTGTWSTSGNEGFTMAGNLTNDGIFIVGGNGTYTFTGAGKSIGGTNSITIGTISISGTYTNNLLTPDYLYISAGGAGDLIGAGTLTQAVGAELRIADDITITTLTANANPNTVIYNGAGTQQVRGTGTTYYNLTINKSAGIANVENTTATSVGTVTVINSLSILAGTLNLNNATDVLTVNAGGTTTITGATSVLDFTAAGSATLRDLTLSDGAEINRAGGTTGSVAATTFLVSGTGGTVDRCNFTVSGATTINAPVTFDNNTGIKTFTGAVTINAAGSWTSTTITTTGNLIFQNGIASGGTSFAAGGATFNTNVQNISGTTSVSFANDVTVTGALVTVTNDLNSPDDVTIGTDLLGTGGFIQSADALLYIGDDADITTFTATAVPNTVTYNGTGTQRVRGTTYYNLTIDKSAGVANVENTTAGSAGTVTIINSLSVIAGTFQLNEVGDVLTVNAGGTTTIIGATSVLDFSAAGSATLRDLTLSDGAEINRAGGSTGSVAATTFLVSGTGGTVDRCTFTVSGATTINAPVTFDNNNGIKTFTGSVTVNATGSWASTTITTTGNLIFQNGIASGGTSFAAGGATFNTNVQNISGTTSVSFANDVTITGALVTVTNDLNSPDDVTIATDLLGTGGFIQSADALLYIGDDADITTFTATAVPNTVTYNGTGTQRVRGTTYYNLTIDKSAGIANVENTTAGSAGTVTVINSLSVIAGTLDLNNATDVLTVNAGGTTTITGATSVLDFSATGSATLRDLTLSDGAEINRAGGTTGSVAATTFLVSGTGGTVDRCTFTVSGATTINAPVTFDDNTGVKTFTGGVTVNVTGSWTSTVITTTNNLIFQNGIVSSGTSFAAGSATFNTNSQSINGTTALSFANVVTVTGALVNVTNNTTVSMTNTAVGTLTGTGKWTQGASSTLNYAGQTITTITLDASGNLNTVEYNRAGGVQTIYAPTPSYHHLIISNTGAATTKTLANTTDINGNLTISGNTIFAASTFNITLAGDWTNNSTNATPFTTGAGSQSVTFDGTAYQQITGSALTPFEDVIVNKGTDITSIVEAVSGGSGMSMNGQLTLTNGMLKLTHASATAEFNASVTTSSTSGLWINGGSFCTSSAVGGDCLGVYSVTFNGLLRITAGSASFGSASGNDLEINDASSLGLAILDIQNGITLDVAGRLFINNGGSMTMTAGDVTLCTVGTALANSGSFHVSATSSVNISGGTVFFQNANSNGTVANREDLLFYSGAGTKTFTGGTFQFGNASTPNATTFYCNDNSLGTPNIIISNATAGGTKPNLFLKSTLIVDGDMTIQAGTTLDASKDGGTNNYDIAMTGNATNIGNWINSGTFTARDKTVTFDGTNGNQSIEGIASTTFNNLTIDNSNGVTVNKAATVNGTLTLTSGIVTTTSIKLLTMAAGSSATSGSATSFVDGPIAKVGATDFTFPTGNGTVWARIGISSLSASETFTAQYFYTGYASLAVTQIPNPLDHVSKTEYWNLDRAGGANAKVQLFWEDASVSGGITKCSDLRIAHWCQPCNGGVGEWENNNDAVTTVSAGCPTPTTESGNIITNAVVSSFSPFTLASSSEENPLPIELLNFEAAAVDKSVQLTWTTATEINNDYFTVERSADGKQFEEVAKVKGAGNSNTALNYNATDHQPIFGISYYHLKQTDFDGKVSFSNIIPVKFGGIIQLSVSPNPSDGTNVTIQIANTSKESKEVLVVVHDVMGREAFSKVVTTFRDGSFSIAFDPSQRLASGVYLITASSDDEIINQRLIIK